MPRKLKTHDLINSADIKRILIIKWSALGDIATATAIFQDVVEAFPEASIDLNTLPAYQSLFDRDKRFNKVIAIDIRNRKQKFRMLWHWIKIIKSNHYDLVVDLQSNDRSRLLLTLMALVGGKIPYRIGNNQTYPYNIQPSENLKNTFRRYQSAIHSAGIPINNHQAVMAYTKDNVENIKRLSLEHKFNHHSYAVLMPGSAAGGSLKRWGINNYAALAKKLHQEGVEKIVLIGAGDEIDECNGIKEKCGDWLVNLCGKTKVLDIIPLCEGAQYIVTNDTGTGRIGAVSKTPMVMIFGPTDRERDIPGNINFKALQPSKEELQCVKCFRKECGHHSCMKMISPGQVIDALKSIH